MIEKHTIFQRFRIWVAELIGGSHLIYKVNMLESAIEGWRHSNEQLITERDVLFDVVERLQHEIDDLVQGGYEQGQRKDTDV